MKKIISLFLLLTMSVSLSSCGLLGLGLYTYIKKTEVDVVEEGNVRVNSVCSETYVVTSEYYDESWNLVDCEELSFGSPENFDNYGCWLKTTKEGEVENLTVRFAYKIKLSEQANVKSIGEAISVNKNKHRLEVIYNEEIQEYLDKYFKKTKLRFGLDPEKLTIYSTNYSIYRTLRTVSESEVTLYFEFSLEWGSVFEYKNPFLYYNGKDPNVEISDGVTFMDHAKQSLEVLEILNDSDKIVEIILHLE